MVRRDGLIVRQVGADTVVYDIRTEQAHCLGRIAATVWREWRGRVDRTRITRRAARALGEPLAEATVEEALLRLDQAGLIEMNVARGRRTVVRKVGALAGLAVLSIAVPSPAQVSATCLANGQPCTRSSPCCSNCCNTSSGRCSGGGLCAPP